MADDEKGDSTSFRGTDWEVVSLTASAYAAAPGLKGFDPPDQSTVEFNRNDQETSGAMFMSRHFIFPPCEHKNLPPVDPDCSEIHNEPGCQDVNPDEEFNGPSKSSEDNWKTKSDDGLHGIQFFDKGKSLSAHSMEFGEGKALQGLTVVGNEQVIYVAPCFSAFHAETDISQSVLCDENAGISEPNDPSHQTSDYPVDYTNASKLNKENKHDGSGYPCEAWWKRRTMSVYNHAKESNSFWSIFVAAALMGIVILGQHWRGEKFQLQQLKWKFSINDEDLKIKKVIGDGREQYGLYLLKCSAGPSVLASSTTHAC